MQIEMRHGTVEHLPEQRLAQRVVALTLALQGPLPERRQQGLDRGRRALHDAVGRVLVEPRRRRRGRLVDPAPVRRQQGPHQAVPLLHALVRADDVHRSLPHLGWEEGFRLIED